VLTGLSLVGVLLGVGIAVSIPPWALKVYIGVLVLLIGLTILRNRGREMTFSWRRMTGLGLLASFSKGISGGGYGPLVTGGQILSGIEGPNAVGIASIAEGITSAAGVAAYLCSGAAMPRRLAPSLVLGAMLSVPVSAYLVSRLPSKRLALIIGGMSTGLGAYTLVRAIL